MKVLRARLMDKVQEEQDQEIAKNRRIQVVQVTVVKESAHIISPGKGN